MKQLHELTDFFGYHYKDIRDVTLMDLRTYDLIYDDRELPKNAYSFQGFAIVDSEISEAVSSFCKKGYITSNCCAGHIDVPINCDNNFDPRLGFHFTYVAFNELNDHDIRVLRNLASSILDVKVLENNKVGIYIKNIEYIMEAEDLAFIKKLALKAFHDLADRVPVKK